MGLLEFPCEADISGVEHCIHKGASESTDELKKLLMRKVFFLPRAKVGVGKRYQNCCCRRRRRRAPPSQKCGAKTVRILCAMREDVDFARKARQKGRKRKEGGIWTHFGRGLLTRASPTDSTGCEYQPGIDCRTKPSIHH